MGDPRITERVTVGVEAWLRWLPKWSIGSYRARGRLCRRCLNSPIVRAAGLDFDVPHQVQHALVSRMQKIIDQTVDEFTEARLPNLKRELDGGVAESAPKGYRPAEGLDPEYEGVELDPEPEPGHPFLFTLDSLADKHLGRAPEPPAPLTEEQKAVLRSEVALADECAIVTGQRVCVALDAHRARIREAIAMCVEPQVRAMLDELTTSLEFPE